MLRRLYRVVLLASPASVRREIGADMEEIFMFGVETAAGRSWPVRAAICARGFGDALLFAVSTRWEHRRQAGPIDAEPAPARRPPMRKQDVLGTLRFLRKQPLFAGAIVGMLALGIGATTALWSVVYGVLLKPLPFPHADRIVEVWGSKPSRGWDQVSLTEANFWDMADMNHVFAEFGAWHNASAILLGGEAPEQVTAAMVSSGFFRSLGVQPVAGRLFAPADDAPGERERVALLSHALWMRRYGGNPAIVGQTIAFGSGPRTVIGVLPPGSPWLNAVQVFVPFQRRPNADRGSFEYTAVGLLKPGVSMEAARADLQVVSANLERQYPAENTGLGIALGPSSAWIASDDLRRALWTLLGSVGLLLVIACVNATNLLLGRATARVRENALRVALGASRGDLVRESLAESLVLSAIATVLGLVLAAGLLAAIQALSPGGVPRLDQVTINGWVFAAACALAVLVGVATGLAPALHAPLQDVLPAIRHGQRGAVGDARQSRLRNVFVCAEVALSVTLLVGAGLLVRSFEQVLTVERGFGTDRRLLATVSIPGTYPEGRIVQTTKDVLARVREMPDVISVASISGRPLAGGGTGLGLAAAGQPDAPGSAVPWASWRIVSKDYFETMAVPLVKGRGFTEDDVIGKPWRTIVSARVADLFWPGQNPIGRTIILWKGQGDTPAEVVGVVGNMREQSLEADPTLAVYFPAGGRVSTSVDLVMHTRRAPEDIVPALRAAVAGVDRNLPISNVRSLDEIVTRSVATRMFTVFLLAMFAGLAVVLALAGVYGVLAYSVTRRTSEIGVRLALGAAHPQVLRLVVAQGLRPVAIGLAIGLVVAVVASRLMASLLFGITGTDPWTYGVAAVAFGLTAALACYLPARQVLRVNPVVALRAD
ncbi:MAG TPA: ABC transporter permease [Vicinamibacterales bacterium]|nr:ABC transporter permease [Vicinamibacterales bacterium]